MINRMLTGWTFTRVIYALMGGVVFIQSLLVMEWLGIIFGGYFTAMGLFGFGCASGQCYPVVKNQSATGRDEIEVEEIKQR